MKADIHPKIYDCQVSCRCGASFTVKSTQESLTLVICNECHPFFTGKTKFVDAAGQVDKFVKKFTWSGDEPEAKTDGKTAGKSKKQILAEVRQEKAKQKARIQKIDQAEAAAQKQRDEDEARRQQAIDAKKAARAAVKGQDAAPASAEDASDEGDGED